jgi:hypothetical protein
MKNSPYLDKPLIPLAVALRSMLAETEAKIAMAEPAEKARPEQRARCCASGSRRGNHLPRRDLDRGRRPGSRSSSVGGLAGGGGGAGARAMGDRPHTALPSVAATPNTLCKRP